MYKNIKRAVKLLVQHYIDLMNTKYMTLSYVYEWFQRLKLPYLTKTTMMAMMTTMLIAPRTPPIDPTTIAVWLLFGPSLDLSPFCPADVSLVNVVLLSGKSGIAVQKGIFTSV